MAAAGAQADPGTHTLPITGEGQASVTAAAPLNGADRSLSDGDATVRYGPYDPAAFDGAASIVPPTATAAVPSRAEMSRARIRVRVFVVMVFLLRFGLCVVPDESKRREVQGCCLSAR